MTGQCDLASLYGETLDGLAALEDPSGDGVLLSRENLRLPPPHLETSRIVIDRRDHDYNSWYRADALHIHLSHCTARLLGLHILASILHQSEGSSLVLSHPASSIQRITLSDTAVDPADPPFGLTSQPSVFRYAFEPMQRHPWVHRRVSVHDLPLFALTNGADLVVTDEDWSKRDTVLLASNTAGNLRLVELLLNAGSRLSAEVEFDLEGDAGARGVAPMSAEVRLVLPGSFEWSHDDLVDERREQESSRRRLTRSRRRASFAARSMNGIAGFEGFEEAHRAKPTAGLA